MMRAELLDSTARFDVQPALREDGSTGPPLRTTVTLRPCWKKPVMRLDLEFVYELGGVAYYAPRPKPS
jgi:hypothetical protein